MPPLPESLRICAVCPNPCRSALGAGAAPPESRLPSPTAYLCYALAEGHLPPVPEIVASLRDLDTVRVCQERCVYGYRIAEDIAGFAAGLSAEAGHAA